MQKPYWPPGPSETEEWQRILEQRPDLAPAVEKEAESNIAELLHKLDDHIANLNAHSDPRISKILSKLSNNIDNLGKKPTAKK